MRLLMIDNYDSFTYNLYQYLGEIGAEVEVVRNDAESLDALVGREPDGVVVSPGPGVPEDAGVSVEIVDRFALRPAMFEREIEPIRFLTLTQKEVLRVLAIPGN